MDSIDLNLSDPLETDALSDDTEIFNLSPSGTEGAVNLADEPSKFKIVAVQSLAGNDNLTQNFLSEMNSELWTVDEKRPTLKIVPIATLKSPVTVKSITPGNKLVECVAEDRVSDNEEGGQVKRFRIDKLGQTAGGSIYKIKQPLIDLDPKPSVFGEIEGDLKLTGSSRRKSRITTRNAEFDEPSMINNVVVNAVREEQVQKARELPQGSKTELEMMRNVAFLRVCVNHILMKIGRRPITYDRNNQTLASLIQKYSKS